VRWATAERGAVPDAGGITQEGWSWLYLSGRLPAKNRVAGAAGRGRKFFKPKRIVVAEERVGRAFETVFGHQFGRTFFNVSECEYRLTIFRRTPREARTGERNERRGDPASAHEFLIDALQGCFYANDEQLVRGSFEELRCQDADGYLFFVRPLPRSTP